MTFIAYLLTLILVPLISGLAFIFTLPLLFVGGANFPRFVSTIQGVTIGIAASWACQLIFSFCNVQFSNTPLWLMGCLFFLNDWGRVQRAGFATPEIGSVEMKELVSDNTKLDSKKRVALFEVGNLFGTPIGFLIWVYWLA